MIGQYVLSDLNQNHLRAPDFRFFTVKPGQMLVGGQLVAALESYRLSVTDMPPSRYQTVRDDLALMYKRLGRRDATATGKIIRSALFRQDHTYTGVLEISGGAARYLYFILSSVGLRIKAAGDDDAEALFDELMTLERTVALRQRREQSAGAVGTSLAKSADVRAKPYGHTAYTRTTRSGKISQVKAKGAKPVEQSAQHDQHDDPPENPMLRPRDDLPPAPPPRYSGATVSAVAAARHKQPKLAPRHERSTYLAHAENPFPSNAEWHHEHTLWNVLNAGHVVSAAHARRLIQPYLGPLFGFDPDKHVLRSALDQVMRQLKERQFFASSPTKAKQQEVATKPKTKKETKSKTTKKPAASLSAAEWGDIADELDAQTGKAPKTRRLIRRVLKSYGFNTRDASRPSTSSTLRKNSDPDPRFEAVSHHEWDGSIVLGRRKYSFLRSAAAKLADGRDTITAAEADAIRVLIHEELHGCSPIRPHAYQGPGVIVEEATTELLARRVLTTMLGSVSVTHASTQSVRTGSSVFTTHAQYGYPETSYDIGSYDQFINIMHYAVAGIFTNTSIPVSDIVAKASAAMKSYKVNDFLHTPEEMCDAFATEAADHAGYKGQEYTAMRELLKSTLLTMQINELGKSLIESLLTIPRNDVAAALRLYHQLTKQKLWRPEYMSILVQLQDNPLSLTQALQEDTVKKAHVILLKARTPYGHTAYTRTSRSGKVSQVKAKGVKPAALMPRSSPLLAHNENPFHPEKEHQEHHLWNAVNASGAKTHEEARAAMAPHYSRLFGADEEKHDYDHIGDQVMSQLKEKGMFGKLKKEKTVPKNKPDSVSSWRRVSRPRRQLPPEEYRPSVNAYRSLPSGDEFGKLVERMRQQAPDHEHYGSEKTFISGIYTQLKKEYPHVTLPQFKAKLLQHMRDGHVTLARADLVSAMPGDKVASSETTTDLSTFHFVRKHPVHGKEKLAERSEDPAPKTPEKAKPEPEKAKAKESEKEVQHGKALPQGKEFADAVLRAVDAASPDAKWGDDKTFISEAFRHFKKDYPHATREQFNRQLLESNRAGHLALSRADLVSAMPPEHVAASEIKTTANANYHFISPPFKPTPRPERVRKALPRGERKDDVPKTQTRKVASKVAQTGKPRYNYPQDKQQRTKPPGGSPIPASTHDHKMTAYVDPQQFANQLQMPLQTIRGIVHRFEKNKALGGCAGFVRFMGKHLEKLVDKHKLDLDYFTMLYDALTNQEG